MSKLIRQDSPACVKSELDLFVVPKTQVSIEKGQWVEYHTLANITDGGPLEFNISGSGEEYLDLNSSYLHVTAKIVKADGTALPEKEPVAPVNLFLHSLFSQVDVSLNERNISSASNTYPYRAYIETLLNYGEDAKKSLLTCEAFCKDNNVSNTNPLAEVDGNEGLKQRYRWTAQSQTLDMIGRLHCDIFQQNRLMLNLVDVKVKLIRSKPEFCLLSSTEDAKYKVVLNHASLFIRKTKVSPGVILGHAKALEKTTAKYAIERVLCKTYSVSKGSWSFMQDNVFLGAMPKRLVLACLTNASMNGQYTSNPFNFEHFDLNYVAVYVDGNPVPAKPLELNFKNKNYIRAYHSLFPDVAQDKGIFLSRDEYMNGYTLFSFDLTPDLCDGDHWNLQHQGNLRIELKFDAALKETISVLVYAEFQNVIEISKNRQVLCDFAN